ncbi:hypothetical protein MPSEU_000996400 [Mayamaea pseudoterrestris]|nr:hypothetical protein MPSEU_000996400 [Mayamaea pseudoterrestris]
MTMASSSNNTPAKPPVDDTMDEASIRSPLQKVSDNQLEADDGSEESSSMRKRSKTDDEQQQDQPVVPAIVLDYPTDMNIPSRELIKEIYNEAMKKPHGEQRLVTEFGLLSFQDVLLPAIAQEEERAVKRLQSIVQRDYPELTLAVATCRKAIYDSVFAGMKAAEASRAKRMIVEQEREQQWLEQQQQEEALKQLQLQKQAEKQKKDYDDRRIEVLYDARKNYAFNQDLFRETAYLLSELPKLQKELKSWKQAEEELKQREAALDVLDNTLAEKEKDTDENKNTNKANTPNDKPLEEIAAAIHSVKASSIQIQMMLENVSSIAKESDEVRKVLYRQYRQEHQFHGYHGATDPKGLLFALSQSQQNSQDEPDD